MLRRLQLTGIAAVVLLAGRGMAAPEPVALDPVVVDLLTEVSQDSLFNAVQTPPPLNGTTLRAPMIRRSSGALPWSPANSAA